MVDIHSAQFSVFIIAAIVLAFTPGPGIGYVVARTASGGKGDGIVSTLGTAIGGMLHVLAAALGLSIIISESAFLFNVVKYAGGCYLIFLGLRVLLASNTTESDPIVRPISRVKVFWEGVTVEVFNVKTALFFLSFIPQFINPNLPLSNQFILYGTICVALNSFADILAVFGSSFLIEKLKSARPLSIGSGSILIGLGAYILFTDTE